MLMMRGPKGEPGEPGFIGPVGPEGTKIFKKKQQQQQSLCCGAWGKNKKINLRLLTKNKFKKTY